ncbi:hypothetical protein Btru_015841 [Bulinus truncatus]|nr:hypothetical protein Btru_015841 [Bulinus truncatus]
MVSSLQILPLFCVIVLLIKEGIALKCYACSSEVSAEACLNPGPTTQTTDCVGNQTMCRKIEQQIYYNGEDHTRVLRQCATSGELGECLERTGTYRYKSWYCQCKGDLCNSAVTLLSPFTMLLTVLSIFCLRFL